MAMPWFRMYAEAVEDEKLRMLGFEDRWHVVAILCCKSQGVIGGKGDIFRRKLSIKLGLQLSELDNLEKRLLEVGLIKKNFEPLNWDKRQFKSDVSTCRVRNYRNKRQHKSKGDALMLDEEFFLEINKPKKANILAVFVLCGIFSGLCFIGLWTVVRWIYAYL